MKGWQRKLLGWSLTFGIILLFLGVGGISGHFVWGDIEKGIGAGFAMLLVVVSILVIVGIVYCMDNFL